MKSFLFSILALVTMAFLVPQHCRAQYPDRQSGFYFHVGGGPVFTEDGEITKLTGFSDGNKISYDTGFAVEGAGGYAFNSWLSTELQTGWIGNKVDRIEGFRVNDTFFYNVPLMANVTLRYRIPNTIVTPFIGAGGGGSLTVFDTDRMSNGDITLFNADDDAVFAYQLFAGVRFDLNERMSLGVGYKYFATEDSSFTYDSVSGGSSVKLGIEGARSHVVSVTFSMNF